jgi:flavin-dependent dehydrogenase
VRRELDRLLLEQAIAAGARFDPGAAVRQPCVDESGGRARVVGVVAGANGTSRAVRAPVTIAADGRRSVLAFGLGLTRHPSAPRRWAIGAYFDVAAASRTGEMHIRRGRYIGVAPVPGGLTNVCLVRPFAEGGALRDSEALLRRELAADPRLRERFAGARLAAPPVVLGPLAVESIARRDPWPDGVILAGDAAGFIDPMTGDGLRFAVRGGELAALAALDALAHGWDGVQRRLAQARRREFAAKWRFNRTLRALVASPSAVRAAALGARLAPSAVRALIARAGDCDLANRDGDDCSQR